MAAEYTWQPWHERGRHHGLAKFRVGEDGLIDPEPAKVSTPRLAVREDGDRQQKKKSKGISSRQWGRC